MIEKLVRDFLLAGGLPAAMEMPESYAPPLVVVEKVGSSPGDRIRRATLAIQSYGATLYDAAALNEAVCARMELIAAEPKICRVVLNSDYNYTDTETKRYRYQAVFDITHYLEA